MQFLIIFWPGLEGSISTVICVDDEIQISLLIVGLWTVYLRWWIASRHIIGKSWSWKNLKYLLVLLRNSMLTLKEQMLVARHSENLQCSKKLFCSVQPFVIFIWTSNQKCLIWNCSRCIKQFFHYILQIRKEWWITITWACRWIQVLIGICN